MIINLNTAQFDFWWMVIMACWNIMTIFIGGINQSQVGGL
jgi:hypothetical protein